MNTGKIKESGTQFQLSTMDRSIDRKRMFPIIEIMIIAPFLEQIPTLLEL